MKWYKARYDTNCSRCEVLIKAGDKYYGSSTASYCKKCKEENRRERETKRLL